MPELMMKVQGVDNLEKALQKLPRKIRMRYLRKALRAGGRPIVREARLRVPKRTRNLYRSIGTVVKKERGELRAYVGTRRGGKRYDGWYGHLVEFGHGGPKAARPHPFLRPAFEAKGKEAVDAMAQVLGEALRAG